MLQQWLGLDLTELTAALGISPPRWRELTTERPDDPLDDPALALLVWSILTFPAQSYLPVYPEVEEVYATYQQLADALELPGRRRLSAKKAFGLLLGREGTSGFRWLAPGAPRGNARQKTRRLMLVFDAVLRAHGAAGLRRWLERVELEAAQRGIDLWEQNSWREKSAPPPDGHSGQSRTADETRPRSVPAQDLSGGSFRRSGAKPGKLDDIKLFNIYK